MIEDSRPEQNKACRVGSRTALVIGVGSSVGLPLLNQLLRTPLYSEVTALLERPLAHADYDDPYGKLSPLVLDFKDLQDYQGYFTVDHVFCCLDLKSEQARDRNELRWVNFELIHVCAQLARSQRAKGFVWLSALNAHAKSDDEYLCIKGQCEDAVLNMPQLHYAATVRAHEFAESPESSNASTSGLWHRFISGFGADTELPTRVSPELIAQQMIELQKH